MKETIYQCDKCKIKQDYSMMEVDICSGYKTNLDGKDIKPFEIPNRGTAHLCDDCFKKWCKLTYRFIYP